MASASSPPSFPLPLPYRIFFLTIEPVSALVGASYAFLHPHTYLSLTHASSSPPVPTAASPSSAVPLGTQIVLAQLANLYLLFAFNEALILRTTSDLRVWRTVLLGLLVADVGHLWSVSALGARVYWDVAGWNKMDWGNVGFVYLGICTRLCFLAGVGLPRARPRSIGRGS